MQKQQPEIKSNKNRSNSRYSRTDKDINSFFLDLCGRYCAGNFYYSAFSLHYRKYSLFSAFLLKHKIIIINALKLNKTQQREQLILETKIPFSLFRCCKGTLWRKGYLLVASPPHLFILERTNNQFNKRKFPFSP